MLASANTRLAIAIELERRRRARIVSAWPKDYTNRETGRTYKPHTEEERRFVYDDAPRYALAKGGEGAGKSVAGIIKVLNRLRRGMDMIMVSPDLVHFRKSLWPEFRRWCPEQAVTTSQRYRLRTVWEPSQAFNLVFETESKIKPQATLYCGGIEDPISWEGLNASGAHLDEMRRMRTPQALKVLDGRARIAGPSGEPPQIFGTSTPMKHWMFDYFGPPLTNKPDPLLAFKQDSLVVTLRTQDNAANLSEGYVTERRQSLSESEARVLLDAEWEDIDDASRFLSSMLWWDACECEIPPLDRSTPIVIALDAAVSGDTFALVALSRHWNIPDAVAIRHIAAWEPDGKPLDYAPIEDELKRLCQALNVVCVTYDPYQLHSTATRLESEGVAWFKPFAQGQPRLIADRQLLSLVMERRLAHDGNSQLRQHVDNANRKTEGERLRIVKRVESLKIDLAVALSMAAATCLELNL